MLPCDQMNKIDLTPLLRASQARNQKQLTNAYSVADATAAREAADYEAAANQQTAAAQTSLAYKLAQARQTPGGGIRMGVRKKGATAGSMGAGLNKANAASKLAKRQAELRAQAKQQYDAQNKNTGNFSVRIGQPVAQIFY